jgi:phosphatidylcholine synthase
VTPRSSRRRVLAWAVHVFTSLGLAAAAGIAVLIVRGGDGAFRAAFGLMCIATLIDAVDGTLARRAYVHEVLPEFDGRRLDDIIDFQTYTSLPLLLIWRAGILPAAWTPVLILPLVASAFGFSRVAAKTQDGYFLGFPSYWNIVAFYLYFLAPPAAVSIAVIVALTVLTFVPVRFLSSTNPGKLNRIANLLAVPWTAMLIAILFMDDGWGSGLTLASLYYPCFYVAASLWSAGKPGTRP